MHTSVPPLVAAIISRVPGWQTARTLLVEAQPGGKTNENYRVTVEGERFILRLGGPNTAALGIDRARERAATLAASAAGIAPEVVAYFLPEGHMVTRFIEGKEWSSSDLSQPDIIPRVAETMRRVHALPPIEGRFDPYRDIEVRLMTAQQRGTPLPERISDYQDRMRAIQTHRTAVLAGNFSLCHNDPWHNNFLDDDTVRLLDWEFTGMGDPYFDLASVTAFFSSDQKTEFLKHYYADDPAMDWPRALSDLEQMLFVALFWNATWALIQIGATHSDPAHQDFSGMARYLFQFMENQMQGNGDIL